MRETIKLPITELVPSPNWKRPEYSNFEIFKMSINNFGLKFPIQVGPKTENGTRTILDGMKRIEALKSLGITEIECEIVGALTEVEHLNLKVVNEGLNEGLYRQGAAKVVLDMQTKNMTVEAISEALTLPEEEIRLIIMEAGNITKLTAKQNKEKSLKNKLNHLISSGAIKDMEVLKAVKKVAKSKPTKREMERFLKGVKESHNNTGMVIDKKEIVEINQKLQENKIRSVRFSMSDTDFEYLKSLGDFTAAMNVLVSMHKIKSGILKLDARTAQKIDDSFQNPFL